MHIDLGITFVLFDEKSCLGAEIWQKENVCKTLCPQKLIQKLYRGSAYELDKKRKCHRSRCAKEMHGI